MAINTGKGVSNELSSKRREVERIVIRSGRNEEERECNEVERDWSPDKWNSSRDV